MSTSLAIATRPISDTPIAVIDFETTGLTPGLDRVVEVAVVRLEPGSQPQLVFDTLVNPMRSMAATEIHGITDADVADAPRFHDIAGELIAALSDCVIAAYNVYFDIKFLLSEMGQSGVNHIPPHFCLMYMRPMLGLGSRCKLDEACRAHNIDHDAAHVAAQDAEAAGLLLERYLDILKERKIHAFSDLARLRDYKFLKSFENSPFPEPSTFNLSRCTELRSRSAQVLHAQVEPTLNPLASYWDALRIALADLEITSEELDYLTKQRNQLGLRKEEVRVLHARAFVSVIAQFISDKWLDDEEAEKLQRLHRCLSKLGWAPGE